MYKTVGNLPKDLRVFAILLRAMYLSQLDYIATIVDWLKLGSLILDDVLFPLAKWNCGVIHVFLSKLIFIILKKNEADFDRLSVVLNGKRWRSMHAHYIISNSLKWIAREIFLVPGHVFLFSQIPDVLLSSQIPGYFL